MMGPIRWMAGNHVAANLLMMVFIVGGLVVGLSIRQEVFPEIELDMVTVSVPYPGAGPEEVEEGIVLKLEEVLSGINGVKEIKSTASEGMGTVVLEVLEGEDVEEVLEDVKAEVDRLTTLPEEAEEPSVSRVSFKHEVISVVVSGDAPELSIRQQAEDIEDELLAIEGITQVSLAGVRPYEISVEVPEAVLRSYGLTLGRIAASIRAASLDVPAGSIKTSAGVVLIRTKEKRYSAMEYSNITVLERPDGSEVKLGDIAAVRDTFADTDTVSRFDGRPAAMVTVYRVGDQKPVAISKKVKDFVRQKREALPESLSISTWNDRSEIFKGRKDLLLRNAMYGLVLVFLTLGLFLRIRLALWVMLGLPISFLGAMLLLPAMDVSINMISLFSFILVLGMVVDDAIVVGESIFEHRLRGKPFLEAAVDGVQEVAGPVVFAILSTIAAFMPLLFISGTMGKFIRVIPLIVVPVLIVSLIECLFILPAHLSIGKASVRTKGLGGLMSRMREVFTRRVDGFISGPYERALRFCLNNRALAVAVAIAIIMVCVGMVGGGLIKFRFMPDVEGDIILVSLQMPVGTTAEKTESASDSIYEKGMQAVREFDSTLKDGDSLLRNVFTIVGGRLEGNMGGQLAQGSSEVAIILMYLTPSEQRDITASQVTRKWRALVGDMPGVDSITFKSNMVDFGANIDIRLAHKDFTVLEQATQRLKQALASYPGALNIQDSYAAGKKELSLKLRPEARTLGITEAELGRQVRDAFYGAEALRFQRGRNEVKVMVRYPEADRKSLSSLKDMHIRTPQGGSVPLGVAARVIEGRGFTSINRTDRKRVVNVTGDVDPTVANAEEINKDLQASVLPRLQADYPGLGVDFEGEAKERTDSMQSMLKGFGMALFVIFCMLAVPFRSYSQPLIIMAAIPFGIVGGILGHLIMGYDLSILSMFGIVALSGVVVNDSLLLIDHINRQRKKGMELFEAVIASGRRRFRPILLTSLTTFFGLAPMILETSMQARFLIPMAISLAFGILFATVITLLLIPTFYMILEGTKQRLGFKY